MMFLYRLTRLKYSYELSGYGASLSSTNRWNSKGIEMIYTATNRALAMAEVIPHLPLHLVPTDFIMMELRIPDTVPLRAFDQKKETGTLSLIETQQAGDSFIRSNKSLLFQVPSFVVKGDHNVLINPFHPDFDKILVENVEPFPFDSRLFHR
jgi:RES domain-containing protein